MEILHTALKFCRAPLLKLSKERTCGRRRRQNRLQVEVSDIMEAFVDVRQVSLDRHLVPRLLQQGVLRATGSRDRCAARAIHALPPGIQVAKFKLLSRWLRPSTPFIFLFIMRSQ